MTLAPPRPRWRALASVLAATAVLGTACGTVPDASGAAGNLVGPAPAQAAPTPNVYEAETSTAWSYTGTWETGTNDRYTAQSGAKATLAFTGTRVELYGNRDDHHGIATVSIDGGPAVDVDLYNAGRQTGVLVWTSPVLTDGAHTLVVTDTDRENPAAENVANPTSIDRAVVTTAAAPPPSSTTTPAPPPSSTTVAPPPPSSTTVAPPPPAPGPDVTYQGEAGAPWTFTGTWSPGTVDTHTRQTGATARLPFTGTGVRLYGTRDAHHGIATVSIDGGPAVDVDQYSATRQTGALLWTSPALTNGNHTLVITMTNRKNPAASVQTAGNAWSLDRAVVSTTTATPPPSSTVAPPPPSSTTVAPPPTSTTTPAPPTTTTPAPTPGGQPLVTRSGRQLLVGGQPFKFAGLNLDAIFGCWAGERERTTDANLDRFFRELNPKSVTRVWAYRNDAASVDVLRRTVAAAERYGQYLMVTLSDANANGTQCGSVKGSTYPADGGAVLAHARALVPQFKDTPAIAFWEIINEGSNDPPAAPWYRTIGLDLKRMDPNTLVVGGAGTCWNGTDVSTCQPTSDSEWNDLVNLHEYDWSNGGVSHHAQNTERLAAAEGLPWFSGESGFCCNGGPAGLTEAQAGQYLAQEWNAYLNAPGSVGMLYWTAKWNADQGPATVTPFADATWETARTFRHQWNR